MPTLFGVDPGRLLTDYHRRGIAQATFRAISIWRFKIVWGGTDSRSILQALLKHGDYAHTFMHPWPEDPQPDARGPYILSRLSVDSFVSTTTEALWAEVDEFLRNPDWPTSRSELGLDELIGTAIEQADVFFELRGSESDRHEMAWIAADEFHDFVVISRTAASMSVVTTSMD